MARSDAALRGTFSKLPFIPLPRPSPRLTGRRDKLQVSCSPLSHLRTGTSPRDSFAPLACRLCVVAFYESAPIQLTRPAASGRRSAMPRGSPQRFQAGGLCPVVTFTTTNGMAITYDLQSPPNGMMQRSHPAAAGWLLASANGKPSACLWNALQLNDGGALRSGAGLFC